MSTLQLLVLALVFGALIHEIGKTKRQLFSIEFRLREKVDKPTELEKLMKEQRKGPKLTKEELDKIMTPEEKAIRKKLYGSEYPIDRD